MTCPEARDLFSALVDDALSSSERAALDAHLATCEDCPSELDHFRATVSLLRAVEPVRAPAGFVDRVMTVAYPTPRYQRLLRAVFLPWPIKLPVEAAAVLLFAVGVVYVFRQTPELQQAARLESPAPIASKAAPEAPSPTEPAREGERNTKDAGRDVLAKTAKERDDGRRDAQDLAENPEARGTAALRPAPPDLVSPPSESKTPPANHPFTDERPRTPGGGPPALAPAPGSSSAPPDGGASLRGVLPPADPGRSQSVPSAAPPAAPSQPAPVPETRAAAADTAKPAPAPPATGAIQRQEFSREPAAPSPGESRMAARAVPPPDVTGRLSVANRVMAENALGDLVTRHRGTRLFDLPAGDATTMEVMIPRAAYAEFVRQLAAIGRWTPDREPAELPEAVRIVLRLTD